ncbi:hypothetical protein ACH35V_05480 [Actinomadura sp. 1N219]|uniref:hypothetical protein n=1 Tax=Actinomadura sp. 1N219 TaxID=3375152 RepID=UPI00378E1E7F
MYLATSPETPRTAAPPGPAPSGTALPGPAPSGPAPLRLARAVSRTFGEGPPFLPDPVEPGLDRMQSDLARPYGVAYLPDRLKSGRRNTYTEMTQALLADLGEPGGPVDLVLVANSAPDADPRRSPSCFLTEALPGDALAFNVSDQGPTTGFTALRLAEQYARDDGFRRVLLVLVDQRTFLYDTEGAAGVPLHDSAVALLFDDTGAAGGFQTRRFTGVTPGQVGALLDEAIAGPPHTGDLPLTLITGADLDATRLDAHGRPIDVRRAEPGRPCTGPWRELAEALPDLASSGPRRVVVADHDPVLHYLCVATATLNAPEMEEPPS